MSDSWNAGSETRDGTWVGEESRGAPFPEDMSGASERRTGPWRRLSCLGGAVIVLAVLAGGGVWLFQADLFHPFGDARACEGSDVQLPDVIHAGGASIPSGASDIHYFTQNGRAEVTFLSSQIPDYLDRAGILPEGEPLFDTKYGVKGDAEDEFALPDGLCGSPLRGPVWIYHSTSATGSRVEVMVERSPTLNDYFRVPARTVVTYSLH
ncbi:hypothetical protein AB0L71_18680 [Streptomyces sp. NPDC052052]|uniref:hypothetical protein n=1 Tax=Streptomyces sp. NPDC052052 TaxID=3154756 RepID=UPI003440538C